MSSTRTLLLLLPLALGGCTRHSPSTISVAAAARTGERTILYYRAPMNPQQTSPVPRKDEMGMDYAPVFSDEVGGGGGPQGLATVTIDPEKRRLIGLRTAEVKRGEVQPTIRTVGRVTYDETRRADVQLRFEGYIEQLHANFTGKYVEKGELLASVYSPELLATEEEYLLALKGGASLTRAGLGDAAEASRARLKLMGIGKAPLDEIARTGRPIRALSVVAPISGFITINNAVRGAKVSADKPLFEIADLTRVWVLAELYEYELPRVALGQAATVTISYWPNRAWQGRVSYISPAVDDKTRTVKVRIEVQNTRTELKPEMFADVLLSAAPRQALLVPDDAVIESGTRKVVFVDLGDGRLEPREITTGDHSAGFYEVRSGLAEGDRAAVGANFLLDSESRLRAALSAPGTTGTKP